MTPSENILEDRSRLDEVLDENERVARRSAYLALFREVLLYLVQPIDPAAPLEVEWLTAFTVTAELWATSRQVSPLAREEQIRSTRAAEQRRMALGEAADRGQTRKHHYDAAFSALNYLKALREWRDELGTRVDEGEHEVDVPLRRVS